MPLSDKDLLAAARIRVANRHPYVAAVLLSLRPIPMPGLGTMGVSKDWKLYYDPVTLQEWGAGNQQHDGVAAVLAHEVWHCLQDHNGRRQDRDPQRWNVATDISINDDLVQARWRLPAQQKNGQCLLPKDFKLPNGETAEFYYEKLPAQSPHCKPGTFAAPGSGGQCGGCAGHAFDFEAGDDSNGNENSGGERMPPSSSAPGVSTEDRELLRRQVAEATAQAAKGSGRGDVPAGLRDWADALLEPPTIDWRKQLAARVRATIANRAGASDYTYARPSRRQWGLRAVMARPPILPSLHQPQPRVGIVLDTSGSMLGRPLQLALAEVVGVVKATGCPVQAWAVDAAVQQTCTLVSARDVEKLNSGGGGTDMTLGLERADKERVDLIILITDAMTPWPERGAIRTPVLVVKTPGGADVPDYYPCVEIKE